MKHAQWNFCCKQHHICQPSPVYFLQILECTNPLPKAQKRVGMKVKKIDSPRCCINPCFDFHKYKYEEKYSWPPLICLSCSLLSCYSFRQTPLFLSLLIIAQNELVTTTKPPILQKYKSSHTPRSARKPFSEFER